MDERVKRVCVSDKSDIDVLMLSMHYLMKRFESCAADRL